MSALLNFVGTIIKTTVITVGIALATAGGVAYATKPENNTLKTDIERQITPSSSSGIGSVATRIASKFISKTTDTNVKDYVFAKTAEVTFVDGSKQMFIGAFQNWFPIG